MFESIIHLDKQSGVSTKQRKMTCQNTHRERERERERENASEIKREREREKRSSIKKCQMQPKQRWIPFSLGQKTKKKSKPK